MIRRTLCTLISLLVLGLAHQPPAMAGFDSFFDGLKKLTGTDTALSPERIAEGLKEALKVGTETAVKLVSQPDGYFANPAIRIPLPEKLKRLENVLTAAGFGDELEAFEKSMNRAAENAAPQATAIFWDAIRQMSIQDAKQILDSHEHAATEYFMEKTNGQLYDLFKPVIGESLAQVGVTQQWRRIDEKLRSLPFAGALSFDLDDYVTNDALDGLFKMVAEEEAKIRKDPAARVTDLLKAVFGAQE